MMRAARMAALRQVLTVASFLFLALVMAMLLVGGSQHGRGRIQNSEFRMQKDAHSEFCILHSAFAPLTTPPSLPLYTTPETVFEKAITC